MRPGEPGYGKGNHPFDPRRGICLSHVVFWSPSLNVNRDGRWAVVLLILPIKDLHGDHEWLPTMLSARRDGAEPSDDIRCAYSLILRL